MKHRNEACLCYKHTKCHRTAHLPTVRMQSFPYGQPTTREEPAAGGEARGKGATRGENSDQEARSPEPAHWSSEGRSGLPGPQGLTCRQHAVDLADLPEALATIVF